MNTNNEVVTDEIAATSLADRGRKYLTFAMGSTEFGIEILKVVEILKIIEITDIPGWPPFAKGTINLRGRVIPVIDMQRKLNLVATESSDQTCIIVVELEGSPIGIEVEAVNEVREVAEADVTDPPNIHGTIASDFILGMARSDGGTIVLLNLERILLGEDMRDMSCSAQTVL